MTDFNCPLSIDKANQLISKLNLSASSTILDAGCGNGELLIRAIEASGASGLGIDIAEQSIILARASAKDRLAGVNIDFMIGDANDHTIGVDRFDVAICIGSTHAFGDGDSAYPNTLDALSKRLRPGGLMLIGDGYWKQPPATEYLKFLGEPAGIYRDHNENIEYAQNRGLVHLYDAQSSDQEWDHFELSHYNRSIERAQSMEDQSRAAMLIKRITEWRNAYLRWGQSTMGFGFYLFMNP